MAQHDEAPVPPRAGHLDASPAHGTDDRCRDDVRAHDQSRGRCPIRPCLREAFGVHEARVQLGHGDAPVTPGRTEGLAQTDHAELRGHVGGRTETELPGHRSDVDDVGRRRLGEESDERGAAPQCPGEVHVHHIECCVEVRAPQDRSAADPCVAHEEVAGAMLLLDVGGERVDRCRVPNVEHGGKHASGRLRCRTAGRERVETVEASCCRDDGPALLCETLDHGLPDAARGAGDDSDAWIRQRPTHPRPSSSPGCGPGRHRMGGQPHGTAP